VLTSFVGRYEAVREAAGAITTIEAGPTCRMRRRP
jgi:hypothetical protein